LVEILSVKRFLSLDSAADIIRIEAYPNAALTWALVNLNLHNLSKVSTANLDLVLDVDEETGVFFEVYLFQVKHVREH